MGQGTDSCGGYEVEYDPYEDGLETGRWTQRNGSTIHVSAMTVHHLEAAKRLAANMAKCATFSCETDKWQGWVDLFEEELATRPVAPKAAAKPVVIAPKRGSVVQMICHCGTEYPARTADIKRGWGLSCGKRCAAIRREFGRPAAKPKG